MKINIRKLAAKPSTIVPLASFMALFLTSKAAYADFADDAKKGIAPVDNGSTTVTNTNGLLEMIVNILLFLVGAVSVIMIIVGGVRFVISRGDQNATASARNTVMYAVVGLIVAVVAYGIVNWLLGKLYS